MRNSDPSPAPTIIIGGGAAGVFAAIACAESSPGTGLLVLEKENEPLLKVRVSGGGRCNLTNACFDLDLLVARYPRGGRELLGPFSRFQPRDTLAWFEARGVKLKTEPDGRVFPASDTSETIIACLRREANRAGVEIRAGTEAVAVEKDEAAPPAGFLIHPRTGAPLRCRRLLLATGGGSQALRWAASLGHRIESPVPSLFTFVVPDPRLGGLAGISIASATLKLKGANLETTGPLLITHQGLGGPAALELSSRGARILHGLGYRAELRINWLPDYGQDELRQRLLAIKSGHPKRSVASGAPFGLPKRLWRQLAAAAGIFGDLRWTDLTKGNLRDLMAELFNGTYGIQGQNRDKEEFVTRGGVSLKDVNLKTMESRRCPGLYFAGEILDIDGLTGGFNLQNAWTTGWVAGRSMGRGFIVTRN